VLDGPEQVAGYLGALGRARPDGVAQRAHGVEVGELVHGPDSHFHAAECGTAGCRYGRFVDPEWHREGQDPDYRFSLANERTFLAWVRTALALLAGSVAIVQLADDLGTSWIRKVVGTALGLTGLGVAALAYRRWRDNEKAMRAGLPLPYTPVLALLGAVLTVVAAVVVVLVLFG
jgi:putative membrane protein